MNLAMFNNGLWSIFATMNNGSVVETYSGIPELPTSLQPTAKTLQSVYLGPHLANCLGLIDDLYPNFPKCGLPFYDETEVHDCVAESCVISGSKGYRTCPFFDQTWALIKSEVTSND